MEKEVKQKVLNLNLPKRTLVIGDQHGGFKAVKQVLKRANFNPLEDKIINLGDVSDGWGETAELVQFWIELQKSSPIEHIFLKGNHDEWVGNWLINGAIHPYWLPQGGEATRDSYIRTRYITDEAHKAFYKGLHNYYIDDENRGFVHGGFVSRKGLGHDAYFSDYYWDRSLFEIAILRHNEGLTKDEGSPYSSKMYIHKEVYIGHTSICRYRIKESTGRIAYAKTKVGLTEPLNVCNIWNMDTGGGFEGKVTIMDIDSKEFWQSDFVKDLYPDEKEDNYVRNSKIYIRPSFFP